MSSSDRAKEIFLTAAERPESERAAYIDRACGDDDGLREKVKALLAADARAGDFLAMPTLGDRAGPDVGEAGDGATYRAGTRIEHYELREVIGEGGFGIVYLAEQLAPVRRPVALKIIKPGMDTRQVIARFEAERQVLAIMDHPCIARVFDAGATDNGRPYFAMELADGVPITRYCEQHRLSIRARLELFALVCDAIEHAHRKGIIHRDIKPNNVLVTGPPANPMPKVIDFGVAKAMDRSLTDETMFTADHQLIGTPQYMSPEQAALDRADIDTRSDVYSLGVLLYELLTGTTPLDTRKLRGASLGEIQRLIREDTPQKPSTRLGSRTSTEAEPPSRGDEDIRRQRRHLKGDLDTIVLTALQKDRERRYASVGRLSEDVRNYLSGRPISARADSVAYRLTRFVGRHRTAVVAAAMVFLSLVAGLIMATREARIAAAQRDVAVANLWQAYLSQARASRSGRHPGRRFESLAVLEKAAQIRPTLELRNEAIACMTLSDVRIARTMGRFRLASAVGLANADRFAYSPQRGDMTIVTIPAGRPLANLAGPGDAEAVHRQTFSPDGRFLAAKYHTAKEPTLWVWDTESEHPVLQAPPGEFAEGIAFDPKGKWIALAFADRSIRLFDLPSARLRRTFGGAKSVFALATDPDGEAIASAGYEDTRIVAFDVLTGSVLWEIDAPGYVSSLAWSPDGRHLAATCTDMMVYVWDMQTRRIVATLKGHQGEPRAVFWDSRGRYLATHGWDNTARIWELHTAEQVFEPLPSWTLFGFGRRFCAQDRGERIAVWEFEPGAEYHELHAAEPFGPVSSVDVAPDGRQLVTAGRNGVLLWDLRGDGAPARLGNVPAVAARFLPDGSAVVASDDEGLKRWALVDGDGDAVRYDVENLWPDTGLGRFDLTPDGAALYIMHQGDVVRYDLGQSTVADRWPGYRGLIKPAVSPDQRLLFTGTWKGDPGRIRSLPDGDTLETFEGRHVIGSFSRDGQWAAITSGLAAMVYRTQPWERVHTISRTEVLDDLAAVASFSPDGQFLALARTRFEVVLLDIESATPVATLIAPHTYAVNDIAFSPDGDSLVIGTPDRVIEHWRLDRIRERLRAMGLDWAPSPATTVAR